MGDVEKETLARWLELVDMVIAGPEPDEALGNLRDAIETALHQPDTSEGGGEDEGSNAAAIEIADAVISWMVKYDLLDADQEYRDDDIIAVLDDLTPNPEHVEGDVLSVGEMEAGFADWWNDDGRFLDPDTSDVPWFDKREALAQYAYNAALSAAQSSIQRAERERDELAYLHSERDQGDKIINERLSALEDGVKAVVTERDSWRRVAERLEGEKQSLEEALTQISDMAGWQTGVPIDTEAANEHARIASQMAEAARSFLSTGEKTDADEGAAS